MAGRLEFGVDFSTAGNRANRRDSQAPFRIALFGPFSGDTAGDAGAGFRPVRIDIDNFDRVLARLAPSVQIDGAAPVTLNFAELDDFHPDALFRTAPQFAALKAKRAELADPARFAAAYAGLAGAAPDDEAVAPDADAADTGSAFEHLLGGKPAGGSRKPVPEGAIDRLIRKTVAAHITPGEDPRQADTLSAMDLAIAEQLRSLLRHPRFRRLEEIWRAAWWLVSNVDDETIEVAIVNTDLERLAGAVAQGAGVAESAPGIALSAGEPWSVFCGLFDINAAAAESGAPAVLAALAHHAGAPWLAGAAPDLIGVESWTQFAGQPRVSAPVAAWQQFRRSKAAPLLGVVAPRVLLRLPYGARTDPLDEFDFEELISPQDENAFLWGNASAAISRLLADEFTEEGWTMSGSGQQLVGDLPAYSYRLDGEVHLKPCAECWLSETAAESLLAQGIMPLVSQRNANAARLVRLQSVAEPARALAGAWTG